MTDENAVGIAVPDGLVAHLHRILQNRGSALEKALAMSYRHPNGFDKISFDYTSLEETTRRLHIWWPEGGDPLGRTSPVADSDVHDHPWNFTSKILLGSLVHRTFERASEGEDVERYERYVVNIPGNSAIYSLSAGTAFLGEVSRMVYSTGDTYSLHCERLHHLSAAPGGVAATLVKQGPLLRRHSEVFRTTPTASLVQVRATKFTPSELRTIVECLLDRMT